ncbi:hypothetical protein WN51_07605 [Melipona quadrifasciata]|uniref:Uncharacterized protein n=1 Tax=Melipona quadrifasciata TaxID=166423 RepID=A0A0N0BBV2_9HYME|nr:hypothetical protein WN51_07605 [Melipona quadrifasciata]
MSANVARDDPAEIGIVDHTMSNGGLLYPIEVCEATIAITETQNPERRHQRVKGPKAGVKESVRGISSRTAALRYPELLLSNVKRASAVLDVGRQPQPNQGRHTRRRLLLSRVRDAARARLYQRCHFTVTPACPRVR